MHRRGLLVVDVEPVPDRFGLVVLRGARASRRTSSHVPAFAAARRRRCRRRLAVSHTVRPLRRRTISSSSMSKTSTASTCRRSLQQRASSPSACGTVRTTPSRIDAWRHRAASAAPPDDAEDHRVGHEIAAIHVRLGLEAERRARAQRRRAARRRWLASARRAFGNAAAPAFLCRHRAFRRER